MDGLAAATLIGLCLLGRLHRDVGPGVVDGAVAELLDAGTGADRLVGDLYPGALAAVPLDPRLLHGILERGTGTLQRAGRATTGRAARGAAAVIAPTSG